MTHVLLLNGTPAEALGLLPFYLDESDSRSAAEQLDANYGHGGGWHPMPGWKMRNNMSIKYPGDRALKPIAMCKFRDELVLFYPHAFVLVLQRDGKFEVARMD